MLLHSEFIRTEPLMMQSSIIHHKST